MKEIINKYIEFDKTKCIIGIILAIFTLTIIILGKYSIKAGIVLVLIFLISGPIKLRKENTLTNRLLYIIYFLLLIVLTVLFTQYILLETLPNIEIKNYFLTFVLVASLILIMYFISGNKNISIIIPVLLSLGLATVNYYVYSFRGNELNPMDILSLDTALNVVGQYEIIIHAPLMYVWLFIIGVFYIGFIFPKLSDTSKTVKRVISLGSAFVLVVVFEYCSSSLKAFYWNNEGTVFNGYLLNFVMQMKNTFVTHPDTGGYPNDILIQLEEEYDKKEQTSIYDKKPHVIVIMNEAFADLESLGGLSTNQEVLPFYNSLKENTIKGFALSSVFGGNTANSEFEFLTGASLAFLPTGSVPYQQYMNRPNTSLVSTLKNNGYTCIATHPFYSNGWSRTKVYKNLGFDEMTFLEDYPQENLLRDFVSDQEMYEYIINKYENISNNEKLFLFGITMQNHGGYTYEDGFNKIIELENYLKDYPNVEQYLSLIHESDKALEYLIQYFKQVNDDVVIVFFGDHLPKLGENQEFYKEIYQNSFDSLDDKQMLYKTPFCVWANYDIEEQENVETSINYLSDYIFDITSIHKSSYHSYINDMREFVPSINAYGYYSIKENKYLPFDEAEGIEKEWLDKYEIIQYNYLFDRKNRNEEFFKVK